MKNSVGVFTLGLAAALGACSGNPPQQDVGTGGSALQQQLDQARGDEARLRSDNSALQQQLSNARSEPAASAPPAAGGIDLVPPNAKPGECYGRVLYPARYETKNDQVLKSAASEHVEVVPAKYEWSEQTVLVKEASTRLVAVPATYKWTEEQQLVKPASTVWKRGHGANERVDEHTGDIMCLVEIPAEYRTVKSKVVDQPAHSETVTIPAEYKTVKVQKLVSAAQEQRVPIPAEYQTVTQTVKVSDERVEWRRVVCQTNENHDLILKAQQALKSAGYNPGKLDGVLGPDTLTATRAYEKEKNIGHADGAITYETLASLGVVS